ncbi:MAG: ROK family transcriptional regulator [Eubacteriales bacterium]
MSRQETGSFSLMKNINTALILHIIRENKNISRAHVSKISGLTPATVTNITCELIGMGLVSEAERGVSKGGRKPVLLRIVEDAYHVIGVYIGSRMIQLVLADLSGRLLERRDIACPIGLGPEEALGKVVDAIRETLRHSEKRIIGIGVGVHGLVRRDEGIAVLSPNLGWENVRIKDLLESEFGLPVMVDNDVHAMTIGERLAGMARSSEDFVLLYVGSGIGGSIVMGNQLYAGATGAAGEFGHTTVQPDGPLCSCGNHGCLQALASEGAMLERYKELAGKDAVPGLSFNGLMEKALAGDRWAAKAISDAAVYIGIGIANIINVFNPTLVVIGGDISKMGSSVMRIINEEVARRCMEYTQSSTRIVFAGSKNESFLRGAASLVIQALLENPSRLLENQG